MKYALLSVYNKDGIGEIARALMALGYTILSSRGTYDRLHQLEVPVVNVKDFTGNDPILRHRVATLDWKPPVQTKDLGIAAFLPGPTTKLDVTGRIEKPLDAPAQAPTSHFKGRLNDFRVSVLKAVEIRFTEDALASMRRYHWPGNIRELQNIVEQAAWMSGSPVVDVEHVAQCFEPTVQRIGRERRRQKADDLHEGLVSRALSFWDDIHPMFLARDLTRHDLRELLHRGLLATGGNYRALLRLYGIPDDDYKRLLNFLAAHDCSLDVRAYRDGAMPAPPGPPPRPPVPAALAPTAPGPAPASVDEERELV